MKRSHSLLIDGASLLVGIALSATAVAATLRTAQLDYRLDGDVAVMLAVLFGPLGISLSASLRLAASLPYRRWSLGEWLLPATAIVELAWCEVWLDAGIYLGAWGKFIGGPLALLGTPLLGLIAIGFLAWSLHPRRRDGYRWTHWLGIVLPLVATAGCVWFVAIMLPM